MAGLKELRIRIDSIKSTQKITSAMKLVAAARLRRAQGLVDKSAFYSNNLLSSAARLLYDMRFDEAEKNIRYVYPELMRGNGSDNNYLLLVLTSDRGLCGSYNSAVARVAAARIEELKAEGKKVSIVCIGRKGRDLLKKRYGDLMLDAIENIAKKGAKYYEATDIAKIILNMYATKQINVCEIVYSQFVSAISRNVVSEQILPVKIENFEYTFTDMFDDSEIKNDSGFIYELPDFDEYNEWYKKYYATDLTEYSYYNQCSCSLRFKYTIESDEYSGDI